MKVFALALGAFALSPLAAFAGDINDVPVAIPEPATLTLMALGVAGALVAARLRNKK
jgi:PEP-CTERM putative exosortase interaction domain